MGRPFVETYSLAEAYTESAIKAVFRTPYNVVAIPLYPAALTAFRAAKVVFGGVVRGGGWSIAAGGTLISARNGDFVAGVCFAAAGMALAAVGRHVYESGKGTDPDYQPQITLRDAWKNVGPNYRKFFSSIAEDFRRAPERAARERTYKPAELPILQYKL